MCLLLSFGFLLSQHNPEIADRFGHLFANYLAGHDALDQWCFPPPSNDSTTDRVHHAIDSMASIEEYLEHTVEAELLHTNPSSLCGITSGQLPARHEEPQDIAWKPRSDFPVNTVKTYLT